jgi:hypothetical protein
MINIFLILLYIYLKHEKLYLSTISYLKINKCYIRNSFCCLLSLVLYCLCLAYKRPTVISQHIWVPFATVSFSHSGHILTKPSLCSSEADPMFPWKKNPRGIPGNCVSMTCFTPRHGVKQVDPPWFLPSFLIFHFPKRRCMRLQKLFSRQHSIYVWSRRSWKSLL